MKKDLKRLSFLLVFSLILLIVKGTSVKAAAISASQVKGTWDGEYDGTAWNYSINRNVIVTRHVTLIFSTCDNRGNFTGSLYLAAIPGKDYQYTGSWQISGTVNLSTGEIVIRPGNWIKTISNFNRSYFGGTFQISQKKLTGYRYQSYSDMTRKIKDYKLSVTKTSNSVRANKLTYISLNTTNTTLTKGKSTTLSFTVSPNTIIPSSVKWTSSNTKVATVSSSGKVKAVGSGTATIICTAYYNGSAVSARCTVNVPYSYTSNPSATVITSLTSNAYGQFLVKWRTVSGVAGYQIRYGSSPSFSNCKTASMPAGKGSYTRKDVTPGALYYVGVRTYKIENGKKRYSSWSGTKSVRISNVLSGMDISKAFNMAPVNAASNLKLKRVYGYGKTVRRYDLMGRLADTATQVFYTSNGYYSSNNSYILSNTKLLSSRGFWCADIKDTSLNIYGITVGSSISSVTVTMRGKGWYLMGSNASEYRYSLEAGPYVRIFYSNGKVTRVFYDYDGHSMAQWER